MGSDNLDLLFPHAPIRATARAALVNGPAYVPTAPTLPTSILAWSCNCESERKIERHRMLRSGVT